MKKASMGGECCARSEEDDWVARYAERHEVGRQSFYRARSGHDAFSTLDSYNNASTRDLAWKQGQRSRRGDLCQATLVVCTVRRHQ